MSVGQTASRRSSFRHEQRRPDRGERKPDRDQDPRASPQLHQAHPGQTLAPEESRLHQTFGHCHEVRLINDLRILCFCEKNCELC